MKMTVMTIVFSLLLTAFLSCSKSSAPAPGPAPPVTIDSTQVQYGTPFTGVVSREDATIYQVNIRSFSAAGNLAGVTARLDSIQALGINVIYLMPVFPVGAVKSVNSPYCVKDYMSIGAEFGTMDDLRAFVNGAHARNMSVLMDFIANHTAWDHPWITAHKDWYKQDGNGNIISPPGTGWADVAQLNFDNNDMRLALIKAMKFWIYKTNIDGFRCDYADNPPIDFWKQAIDSLRAITTHKLLMLAEGTRSLNYSAGFDYNFGFGYFNTLKNVYAANRAVTAMDSVNAVEHAGAATTQQVVRYTTNHDVNSSDGTPEELFGGQPGALSAYILAAYQNSVPMMYSGQEVGTPYRLTFPFTSAKIDWTQHPAEKAEYKKILAFRNNSKALRSGTLTSYSSADVAAFVREAAGEKILVLVNVRDHAVSFSVPAGLQNSSWKDVWQGTTFNLGSGSISLQAYEYMVLKM